MKNFLVALKIMDRMIQIVLFLQRNGFEAITDIIFRDISIVYVFFIIAISIL